MEAALELMLEPGWELGHKPRLNAVPEKPQDCLSSLSCHLIASPFQAGAFLCGAGGPWIASPSGSASFRTAAPVTGTAGSPTTSQVGAGMISRVQGICGEGAGDCGEATGEKLIPRHPPSPIRRL